MSINFFDEKYQETPRKDKLFGICDDENGTPAYTDVSNRAKWIAEVINEDNKSIIFTPIDNCIIIYKSGTPDKESTCDGMLAFTHSLFLLDDGSKSAIGKYY
jgi:hypothetical protein